MLASSSQSTRPKPQSHKAFVLQILPHKLQPRWAFALLASTQSPHHERLMTMMLHDLMMLLLLSSSHATPPWSIILTSTYQAISKLKDILDSLKYHLPHTHRALNVSPTTMESSGQHTLGKKLQERQFLPRPSRRCSQIN
jgi:hypothetical protein